MHLFENNNVSIPMRYRTYGIVRHCIDFQLQDTILCNRIFHARVQGPEDKEAEHGT